MKKPSLAFMARALAVGALALLGGCSNLEVFNPKGWVGVQEKNLLLTALCAMLIVVIPVIIMAITFTWRYRASNTRATYSPRWAHSTVIETIVWIIPICIIVFLGTITWKTSHELDPFKPLDASVTKGVKPIEIDVVALDWKWFFIYPDYNIATVNQIALPVGTPVKFRITSDEMMNVFFIPQLGSQIYAMAGMQTQLNLIADEAGTYKGMSANYSGLGFANMHFDVQVTTQQAFDDWVAKARGAENPPLTMDAYKQLAQRGDPGALKPDPVKFYSTVPPSMFDAILHDKMAKIAGADSPICTPTSKNIVAISE